MIATDLFIGLFIIAGWMALVTAWITWLQFKVERLEIQSRQPCNPCRDDNAANCERTKQ